MAGKPMCMRSREMHHTLDSLSKNTLGDLLMDFASMRTGHTDDCTDEEVLDIIQQHLNVVAPMRGDKPINLRVRYKGVTNSIRTFKERQGLV